MIFKKIFIILAICLFLTACVEHPNANTAITTAANTTTTQVPHVTKAPENEVQEPDPMPPLSKITLGMTPKQMLDQLEIIGVQIEMPDYSEYPLPDGITDAVEDGRIYNMTDISFYYKAKDHELYLTFDPDGLLCTITNRDKAFLSAEGLEIGVSLDEAKAIYGTDYTKDPEEMPILQYNLGDGYLNIFYENDTVTGWTLSKYPNINND